MQDLDGAADANGDGKVTLNEGQGLTYGYNEKKCKRRAGQKSVRRFKPPGNFSFGFVRTSIFYQSEFLPICSYAERRCS